MGHTSGAHARTSGHTATARAGRRGEDGLVQAPATPDAWANFVAMALLWVVPVVAFALVMMLGGGQTP